MTTLSSPKETTGSTLPTFSTPSVEHLSKLRRLQRAWAADGIEGVFWRNGMPNLGGQWRALEEITGYNQPMYGYLYIFHGIEYMYLVLNIPELISEYFWLRFLTPLFYYNICGETCDYQICIYIYIIFAFERNERNTYVYIYIMAMPAIPMLSSIVEQYPGKKAKNNNITPLPHKQKNMKC